MGYTPMHCTLEAFSNYFSDHYLLESLGYPKLLSQLVENCLIICMTKHFLAVLVEQLVYLGTTGQEPFVVLGLLQSSTNPQYSYFIQHPLQLIQHA